MPNISFDIFYNTDIINVTATRSGGAPKPKPDWKIRTAPKLAPKPKPTPESAFGPKTLTEGPKETPVKKSADADKPAKPAPKLQKKQETAKKQGVDNAA